MGDGKVNRYPAPHAEKIWSDEGRISRLRHVSDEYAIRAIEKGLLGPEDWQWTQGAIQAVRGAPDPLPDAWRRREDMFGHEIVGFLGAYLDRLPADVHPYVHYGLTSSDLVEHDLHCAIAEHAREMEGLVVDLRNLVHKMSRRYANLDRAGRTHGQLAEATTLGHQLSVFRSTLARLGSDMTNVEQIPHKSPGPTGVSPVVTSPWQRVPSTQIIPRDFLLRWASAYLNLSNTLETMAMFVRLGSRSEVGEFREGRAKDRQGSSAMPGKSNPIQSERVCGLARVVRGHFLSLAEVSALWEDRDLSNSSTERIAVPGLASTVEYMLDQVYDIFSNLEVDEVWIRENATDPRCRANERQRVIQKTQRVGPIEASRLATERTQE